MEVYDKLLEKGIRVNYSREQQKVICPKCMYEFDISENN